MYFFSTFHPSQFFGVPYLDRKVVICNRTLWDLSRLAAVNWCNMDFCESNYDGCPPMKLVTNKDIDHMSWCIAHFGDFVMAPITFINIGKNRIDTCIHWELEITDYC